MSKKEKQENRSYVIVLGQAVDSYQNKAWMRFSKVERRLPTRADAKSLVSIPKKTGAWKLLMYIKDRCLLPFVAFPSFLLQQHFLCERLIDFSFVQLPRTAGHSEAKPLLCLLRFRSQKRLPLRAGQSCPLRAGQQSCHGGHPATLRLPQPPASKAALPSKPPCAHTEHVYKQKERRTEKRRGAEN